MASGTNEVKASVHSEVNLVLSLRLLLLKHIALVLIVQELDDWLPAVTVVHVVTEPRSINDSQADLEELLFQLSLGDLDLHGLVDLLGVTAAVVGIVFDGSAEQRVDEGRLSQARFACDHDGERGTALGHNLVALVGKLRGASVSCAGTLLQHIDIHWQCQLATLIPP